jgi:uncharacterized protein
MKIHPLRLHPGQDLLKELIQFTQSEHIQAACILTCVGSLRQANLRLANHSTGTAYKDKFEIVSLVGTLSPDGPHLHMALSDGTGKTTGGHVLEGCLIYTTAEIVFGILEDVVFRRELDPETTYHELVIDLP